ncbi:hypothetical protein MXB_3538, partial [Myxobolus squamalis]
KCRADSLIILSGDAGGSLYLTDIHTKKLIGSCLKFSGPVKQIQWVSFSGECNSFALVYFYPETLALFSDNNLYICWCLKFPITFNSFSLNSLNPDIITINSSRSIFVYNDYCHWHEPKTLNNKLIVIEEDNGWNICSDAHIGEKNQLNLFAKSSATLLNSATSVFKNIQVKVDNFPSNESIHANESSIIDCAFVPFNGDILYIVGKRWVIVFNLNSSQILTKLSLYHDILLFTPSKFVDAFIVVHQNNFSLYASQKKIGSDSNAKNVSDSSREILSPDKHAEKTPSTSYTYVKVAITDAVRIGRQTVLSSFAVNPITESESVFITRHGHLLFYKLPFVSQSDTKSSSHLYVGHTLNEFLQKNNLTNFDSCIEKKSDLKFIQSAVLYNINFNPTCVRVSPPLSTKAHRSYRLYAALGFSDGSVQIYYLPYGVIRRNFNLFSESIKQLEWLSSNVLIAFTTPTTPNKIDIRIIDVLTGKIKIIIKKRNNSTLNTSHWVPKPGFKCHKSFRDQLP